MVAAMEDHARQDRLVAGTYGEKSREKFYGCSVGCSIYTINQITGNRYDSGDHTALAYQIGIPDILVWLQDVVFEGLPATKRTEWPVRFYQAIPEESDLTPSLNQINIRILREVLPLAINLDTYGIKQVVEDICWTLETRNGPKTPAETVALLRKIAGSACFLSKRIFIAVADLIYTASIDIDFVDNYSLNLTQAIIEFRLPHIAEAISDIIIDEMKKCAS